MSEYKSKCIHKLKYLKKKTQIYSDDHIHNNHQFSLELNAITKKISIIVYKQNNHRNDQHK